METTAISLHPDITDKRLVRAFSYIGGKWTAAQDGTTLGVTNPADGSALGDIACLSTDESARAVDVAQTAFSTWSALLPQERSTMLRRWFDLMIENREDLARIMVLEQGKPSPRHAARSTMPRVSLSFMPKRPSAPISRASPATCTMPRSNCGSNRWAWWPS